MINHEITFQCDACETLFTIDEESMELPPGWLGLQIVAADSEGTIPEHEQEIFGHFCSQKCLIEYARGDELRARLVFVEKSEPDVREFDDPEDIG